MYYHWKLRIKSAKNQGLTKKDHLSSFEHGSGRHKEMSRKFFSTHELGHDPQDYV